nr:apoptosis-inducing factor homolog A-like [Tanacetum cinerariifolium]
MGDERKKRVVVVGGGIAGSLLCRNLLQCHDYFDFTLIDSKEYLEITWANLRSMVEPSFAKRTLINHHEYLPGASIITSDAIGLDEVGQVSTSEGRQISYDYLVIATGHIGTRYATKQERLRQFEADHEKILSSESMLIVGGGPTGVELAGEIATDFPGKKVTLVHRGTKLLEFIGESAGKKALNWLNARNVKVILGQSVDLDSSSGGVYETSGGEKILADCHFKCTSEPIGSSWLKETILKNSLDDRGRLMVDGNLRVKGFKNIFAIGDVNDVPELKQGFLAQKHALVVASNLKLLVDGGDEGKMVKYNPASSLAIVSLGRRDALLHAYCVTIIGRVPGRNSNEVNEQNKVNEGMIDQGVMEFCMENENGINSRSDIPIEKLKSNVLGFDEKHLKSFLHTSQVTLEPEVNVAKILTNEQDDDVTTSFQHREIVSFKDDAKYEHVGPKHKAIQGCSCEESAGLHQSKTKVPVTTIKFIHHKKRFEDVESDPNSKKSLKMKRVFGAKKDKQPPPTLNEASDRINKRGESVDEKIKRLDGELSKYKEQIKRTRPGPAQEAVKARAMRVLKQKRMYEGQRDMLYNQTFNLDQVAFASEGLKDAQQTMSALKTANKELKGMMKTVKIQEIDNLQDDMLDLMDESNEIQESLGRSYNVPDDIDEEDLMGELDALEADMGFEMDVEGVPSYLQPDNEPDYEELNLPSAPSGHAVPARRVNNQVDKLGLPPVPRASLRS